MTLRKSENKTKVARGSNRSGELAWEEDMHFWEEVVRKGKVFALQARCDPEGG
jgi:hypothetical protein